MDKKKILVADAGEEFRRLLVETIDAESDLAVVGDTGDGEEAVSLCAKRKPDVVVMDMILAKMDGVEVLASLSALETKPKILVLSSFAGGGLADLAAANGAEYFMLKPCKTTSVVERIRQCSATSFLRNWDSILEKKRANLRSISEPARLRQPPPRSTGAAHARGRAQSIREERRIAAPPVLFALLRVRLLPALYGPFCGPLRPFGGCPWGVTPPARECLPPAPPDTRRRG